jgi:hypothetical protein
VDSPVGDWRRPGRASAIDVGANCGTCVATVTDEPNFERSMNNPEKS